MDRKQQDRFQVDLRGLIDLLSRHLYSGPAVFVRELLQNGVDAVFARQQIEPGYSGTIQIELIESKDRAATLLFQDDGIGLTEDEIHGFLATIGQSSKRAGMVDRPEGFLGQFGIGLLSCFMVTDEIVVITRSARQGDHGPLEWRGSADGTYCIRAFKQSIRPGTQVFLRAKHEAGDIFQPAQILALARHYGEFLGPHIVLTAAGRTEHVNAAPPWDGITSDSHSRQRLLEYGARVFDRSFLDVIKLRSSAGQIDGIAYVLAEPVHAGANQLHRVYLKNMLLSAKAHDVLPDWAFFVQCIVNAKDLRPTASRESLYEDGALQEARCELGQCLRRYLIDLARREPQRFQHLISVHHLSLKALALDDDECLELFSDWFPFETSLGTMPFGEFRRQQPIVRYVPSRDQFQQIAQVAVSEELPVINAGYVYDVEILERIGALRSDVQVEAMEAEQLSERFEELTLDEREDTVAFERLADATLQRYKCAVNLTKFRPVEMPALYVTNKNADFLRSAETAQEVTDDLWTGVLGRLTEDVGSIYARLHLNYHNPLVRRISGLADRQAQRRCVEMLYVQSLLLGHFPLKQDEMKLINQGLLGLIDWALDGRGDGDHGG